MVGSAVDRQRFTYEKTDKSGDTMTMASDARPGIARTFTRKNKLAGAVSAAVVASTLSTPASSKVLEEVIVTATKRA